MIEFILIERETDNKAGHTFFPDNVSLEEITEWSEGIDTTVYDIYQKVDVKSMKGKVD